MRSVKPILIQEVALPWSDGSLSARMWQSGSRVVVAVPELGLNCYGSSQSEAVLRLFTSLLKYYCQLKDQEPELSERGREHFCLLKDWVASMEERMQIGDRHTVAGLSCLPD